ncbi:MAG: FmdB family zinc ribbon protein, partial [Polyangiales bacterium]
MGRGYLYVGAGLRYSAGSVVTMPTYSYACDACGHTFEAEQRITADALGLAR